MSNNLATILDQDSGPALVREYLDKTVLERRDWGTPLANSKYAVTRVLPKQSGQYVEFTRKNRLRRPQHLPTPGGQGSDPLSGALLSAQKLNVPMEYIHEYMPISTVTQQTSWMDLEEWAEEDMPLALKRRMHELTQNAFVAGRMAPGVYAANGTLSTGFDQAAQATVTLYGNSFTFDAAPVSYGSAAANYAALLGTQILTWADLAKKHVELSNAGAEKFGMHYVCCLSDAQAQDLIQQDEYFEAAIRNYKPGTDSLSTNRIATYKGWIFEIDPWPFTSDVENVRTAWGAKHTALCFGKNAFGYVPLGGATKMRPKFKIQDITLTGYEKTIGYLVPWQVAILNADWCCCITSDVSVEDPNNAVNRIPDAFETMT